MPKIIQQKGGKQPPKKSTATSVLTRIKALELPSSGITIAIYGKSGTGKTTLWSSFPKPALAAIASGAGETRSIHQVKGIDAVDLESEEELLELIEHQAKTQKYKTFILDHASGYQDLVLKKILEVDEVPTQLGWGSASQQQWGELALRMKSNFRAMLALAPAGCNVVIVAQEREFNTDGESSGVLTPYVNCALTPSVTGWLGPAVDYLVETFLRMGVTEKEVTVGGKKVKMKQETGKVEFCLRTAPHPVYATKFRLPKGTHLPDVIVDPDYAKILKLIEGRG